MKFRNHIIALMTALVATASFAQQLTLSNWTPQTINNATASVNSSGDLNLSVVQTSWSQLSTNLGNLNGQLTVSFNYKIQSQGWWEIPYVEVLTNPQPASGACISVLGVNPITCGTILAVANHEIPISAYGTTAGSFTETIAVNGQTNLIAGIVPSEYSGNSDHYGTYFTVSNLTANYVAAAPVPEPETYAMLLAGMGVIAFLRRRKSLSKI